MPETKPYLVSHKILAELLLDAPHRVFLPLFLYHSYDYLTLASLASVFMMLNQHKPTEGWRRQSSHLDCNRQNAVFVTDSAYLMCVSTKGHRSATTVKLQYSRVMRTTFLQVTVCILYVTLPSHTINLLVVFVSLSILKGCASCKRSWCPSEISLLTEEGHSDMQGGKKRALPKQRAASQALVLCSFCFSVCVCVAHAKWQKLFVVTETQPHTEESLRTTTTTKNSQTLSWVVPPSVSLVWAAFETQTLPHHSSLRVCINIHSQDCG